MNRQQASNLFYPDRFIHLTRTALSFLGILLMCIPLIRCGGGPKTRPDVLLIVSDALRKDMLGCYGGPAHTPNIDRLAENGVLFEKAYSTAPSTFPSSTAMLTGGYARSYIVTEDSAPDPTVTLFVNEEELLLGEVLRERDYDVLLQVENGLAKRSNNVQGFGAVIPFEGLDRAEIEWIENSTGIRSIGGNPDKHQSSKYDKMYGMLHYLLSVPQEQNFFLLKWFADPHVPYHPPKKFQETIPLDSFNLPRDIDYYMSVHPDSNAKNISPDEIAFFKELYRADVESVDERVGLFLKALEESGRLDNTIIVFTSDHGEMFGEHNRMLHGRAFYDTLVNVPLIFSGPGISKGRTAKSLVSLVDLMPTLETLLLKDPRDPAPGRSFASLLTGGDYQSQPAFIDRISNQFLDRFIDRDALVQDEYKLVAFFHRSKPAFELFNLAEDPGEQTDISEEYPEIVREMYKTILRLRQECDQKLKENLAKIDPSVDIDQAAEKTRQQLRALGYIK